MRYSMPALTLRMTMRRHTARGFNLLELMTVLLIIAILMIIAVPNFKSYQLNSKLSSSINDLSAALTNARVEAMRRGSSTTISAGTTGWGSGWTVTAIPDGSTSPTTLATHAAFPLGVTVGSASTLSTVILFSGDGFPRAADSSAFLTSNNTLVLTNGIRTRQLIIAATGQIRVCDPTIPAGKTGTCSS